MRAARPAAWPALALSQALASPGNTLAPCLGFFRGFDPANPFVAGERRNILPRRKRCLIMPEQFAQVCWEIVNDPAGNGLFVRHEHSPSPLSANRAGWP